MIQTPWNAIVLAGGRASRLGGIDKTALRFEGMSLLEHALVAVSGARTIVVGPESLRSRLPHDVQLLTEHPRFGGPAAATVAGLHALGAEAGSRTALVAADLPHAAAAMRELLAVGRLADRVDGVVATDGDGIAQPLLAIYDTTALTAAARLVEATGPLAGASMRALIAPLVLCRVRLSDALCADVDTPEAAERHGIPLERVLSHV